MTVPALRELRRVLPSARITMASRGWAKGIFDGADFVDDFMNLDRERRNPVSFAHQAREWKKRRFDLAIIFPNAFEPALLSFAARVPIRVGYATDRRGALLTNPLAVPAWRGQRHEVFYYLNIIAEVERLFYGTARLEHETPSPELEISSQRKREARALLQNRGLRLDRPVIALCPGSTNSRAKRWPSDRFAALGDMLSREANSEILLIGSPEDSGVANETASMMRSRPIVMAGETTLAESAAVLSICDLLVTNDTGPAHLAAAVGCPVVVIFGPTDPVTTRPFSEAAVVVRQKPECAPCMLRDCPIDHRCMTAITADEVFGHATQLLAHRATPETVR